MRTRPRAHSPLPRKPVQRCHWRPLGPGWSQGQHRKWTGGLLSSCVQQWRGFGVKGAGDVLARQSQDPS